MERVRACGVYGTCVRVYVRA
eukprot:COSAG01_NODE_77021_length_173_cov_18.256757_1_plen_20_part_10